MHGKGILYFKDGSINYQGDFITGYFEGFGTLNNEKPEIQMNINYNDLSDIHLKGYWNKYEGTFQMGQKQGHGYLYLTDSSILFGMFNKDQINGEGFLKRPKQNDLYAEWKNGILYQINQGQL